MEKEVMRKTNNLGVELIKFYEGFSSREYICSAGYKTIGYGHKIKPSENFLEINRLEAEQILQKDLRVSELAVCRHINANLTENQFSAIVSFTYNLGGGSLQRSSLRQKINYGSEDEEIYDEFLKWCYAGGRKLSGLFNRRRDEAELFFSK
jgi:lysozyme